MTTPTDEIWRRSRTSLRTRLERVRSKSWAIVQCALAAGLSYWLAGDLLGHPSPFFAPIAAVVCLGTSYGQRLQRVVEVTVGVAVGVFIADLLVQQIGSGAWQVGLIVALATVSAILLDGRPLFVTQAAVQSIIVAILVPEPGAALTRWSDAVIGGLVALVAATVVPAAPLRRPREQAARVLRRIGELLRASAEVMESGEAQPALDLLADARATDYLIRELSDAADEGLAVVASSPFRVRHGPGLRKMAELVDPLDRALRSTRVLVRQVAVAAYHRRPIPPSYVALTRGLAEAIDVAADELAADRQPVAARDSLVAIGRASGEVERSAVLSAEVVLAQLRSLVADLLMVTGLEQLEATDALPPPADE